MSIYINKDTKVITQGITGKTGQFHTRMCVAYANGNAFAGKIGAAVVAVRRGGAIHVFDSINHMFQMSQMIVPGSTYWNMGFGLEKGEVAADGENGGGVAEFLEIAVVEGGVAVELEFEDDPRPGAPAAAEHGEAD